MWRFLDGHVNVQENQKHTGYFEGACQDSAIQRCRWHQRFAKICDAAGLRSCPGSPTVLQHENVMRKIYVNAHVDDILLVCKPEEMELFQDAVGFTLTMKVDGPHLPAVQGSWCV